MRSYDSIEWWKLLKIELARKKCAIRKTDKWLNNNPLGISKARDVIITKSMMKHYIYAEGELLDAIYAW